jgi:ABC-type transport system involved in multi-copper enzyme maturation permease subunit
MVTLLRRELLASMRLRRSFACLALLVGIAILVILSQWPDQYLLITYGAWIAQQVFMSFAVTLLIGAAIFVPALSSGAIVSEKESGTFDLLILTLIKPSGMIIAKVMNTVGLLTLMIVATIPVMAAAFFLLGIEWMQLIQMVAILLFTTVSASTIGIFCSAVFRRGVTATVASYLMTFFVMGGYILVAILLWYLFLSHRLPWYLERNLDRVSEFMFLATCPMGTLSAIFESSFAGFKYVVWALLFHVVVTLIFLRLTLRVLRRPPKPLTVTGHKVIDDATVIQARRKKFPYYLIDPRKRKKPIEDGRNPMLVRELRWGLGQRASIMVRTFYCAFAVCLFIVLGAVVTTLGYSGNEFEEGMGVAFVLQIGLILVVAPIFVASSLTKEREQGNLDMLRMTLLPPRSILMGKVAAGAVALSPLVFAVCVSSLMFFVGSKGDPGMLIMIAMGYVTLFVSIFLCLSLTLLASTYAVRTVTSIVSGYVVNIMVFVGIPFLVAVIEDFLPYRYREEDGLFLSPLLAFPGSFGSMMGDGNRIWLWCISMTVWTLIALTALAWTNRVFQMRHMRE